MIGYRRINRRLPPMSPHCEGGSDFWKASFSIFFGVDFMTVITRVEYLKMNGIILSYNQAER